MLESPLTAVLEMSINALDMKSQMQTYKESIIDASDDNLRIYRQATLDLLQFNGVTVRCPYYLSTCLFQRYTHVTYLRQLLSLLHRLPRYKGKS